MSDQDEGTTTGTEEEEEKPGGQGGSGPIKPPTKIDPPEGEGEG